MPAPTANLPIVGNIVTAEGRNAVLNDALAALYATANPEDRERAEDAADRADLAATASAASAAEALLSETQAALAALAAGAPIVIALTDPVPANGTVELLKLDAGLQVHEVVAGAWVLRGWLVGPTFDTREALFADTSNTLGPDGTVVEYGPHRAVVDSTLSVSEVPHAGGVKLAILPNAENQIVWEGLGPVSGAADHSALFDALFAAMARAGTNTAVFGPGTWRSQYRTMPEGFTAICARWLTFFTPISADDRAIFTMDSGSPTTFLKGPHFRHATFMGLEAAPTFSEQKHLITLHGFDFAVFSECSFIGWRGDAIYAGSSDTGGTTERHNKNLFVLHCHFEGVNNENRQAISCIDIDGLYVMRSRFFNCTKSNMPGVIDLEPNANAFHIIRNIYVEENRFEFCGGNVGTVCFYVQAAVALPYNIHINRNTGRNLSLASGAGFVGIYLNIEVDAEDVDMNVNVNDNDVRDSTGRPYQLRGVKGFKSKGNVFADMTLPALFGFTLASDAIRDVTVCDKFIRVGTAEDSGADVFTATNLDLSGSTFDDVSSGTGTTCAINFKTGTSVGVKLNDVTIVSPTGMTVGAVIKDAGHTFTPATNQHFDCEWGALLNGFEAHQSDTLMTPYAPVIEGTTTAGTGTYTRQHGRWRRVGRQVFCEIEVVQTAHDGTGQIEISLPVAAAGASSNPLVTIPISIDGAATTGGQIGGLNSGAAAGGVSSAIRCFHTGTGTLAQTIVPSGAATYRASGTYMAA